MGSKTACEKVEWIVTGQKCSIPVSSTADWPSSDHTEGVRINPKAVAAEPAEGSLVETSDEASSGRFVVRPALTS